MTHTDYISHNKKLNGNKRGEVHPSAGIIIEFFFFFYACYVYNDSDVTVMSL